MSHLWTAPLALLLVLGGAAAACAQAPVIYGSHNDPPLIYAIDTQTGAATLVKNGLPETQVAIGRDPQTDLVWLIGNVGTNPITTWDPATDTVTNLTAGFSRQYHRFDAAADGTFYGVELNSRALFKLNSVTGQPAFQGNINGAGTGGATGDLAFAPGATDEFYYAVSSSVYRVNLDNLNATFLGSTGAGSNVEGLAFDTGGTLYMATAFDLWTLDLQTGAATHVGPTGALKINDLANGLSSLFLEASPSNLDVGDPLSIVAKEGEPGQAGALVVTEVGGQPTAVLALLQLFDPSCEYTLGGNVPPPLSGLNIKFRVIGFTKFGGLETTNEVEVTVN